MAKRITEEDIFKINEMYLMDPVYSHVAKAMGISAATVKKYIVPDFKPLEIKEKISKDLPSVEEIELPKDYNSWLELTDEEFDEIQAFKRDEVQI